MSNINKQELREAAERAESDSWGYDRDEFNEALTPSTVLALLDELEAKDSMIAAQQHEIRTLLNALEGRPCPKCNDTGMADSGGTQPWGEPISVPCDCAAPPAPASVPAAMEMDDDFDSAFEHGKAVGWNAYRAAMLQGSLVDFVDWQSKRIAGLEAREVVLPSTQDVHPLGPQSAKIFCEFHRSIVNRCADEIRKVGVKVSIKGN
ncbi:ead/Ea22-like family protein [Enterobacter hormaechei]|uniref:ead/Ea22-like family protein n=1 Tax=Enterobacter hormaechei TaxID=158836 RepID=UPI0029309EB4|nr:ead/Ea22-like family protein [Enterobacter hormaechei]